MNRVQPSSTFELKGPDGGKLLGFLAALGALAALTDALPDRDVRLSWTRKLVWRPILRILPPCSQDDLVHDLCVELKRHAEAPEFVRLGDDLPVDPSTFRKFAEDAAAAASATSRRWADFAAAWGSETILTRKGVVEVTRFRTQAGQQRFLRLVRRLVEETSEEQIRSALVEPWAYEDDEPCMRWDPIDDRRYAYRADDPAKAQIHTVRGANRMAVEALRLFATVPQGSRLATTGFSSAGRSEGRRDVYLRWPIWNGFISASTVRSLLVRSDVWSEPLRLEELRLLGIREIFECRRIGGTGTSRYRNFTTARPLIAHSRSAAG